MMPLSLAILVGAYVALFVTRAKLGAFWSISLTVLATLLFLHFGVYPPLPSSVISLFTVFVLIAAVLYITASRQILLDFWAPIRDTIVNPKRRTILATALVLVPILSGWRAWVAAQPDVNAPAAFRVVHPAPPAKVNSHGQSIDLKIGTNPLRDLAGKDAAKYAEHVKQGERVYYENCYFCHGDELQADGHFAEALTPIPASFRDKTTIAMFTETFLFWRVAKGGPGLPDAATPWDSAMPIWEDFLTNEEMWQVILYLYERTNQAPREVGHGEGAEH